MRKRVVNSLLGLLMFGVMPGCGEKSAPPPPAEDTTPVAESGTTIPSHGVVVIVASRAAERVGPSVGFDALAEAEIALKREDHEEPLAVQSGEAFGQPGRLRFYLEPVAGRSDEEADGLVGAIYDRLAAELDASLRAKIQTALDASTAEQATLKERVGQAQAAMSSYLSSRRGIPDTPESRREKARLDHALTTANAALLAASEDVNRLQEALDAQPTALRRVR